MVVEQHEGDLQIYDRVRKAVAEVLNVKVEDISLESRFVDDLGADSIDFATLVMLLDEQFKTSISEQDAVALKSVGDVVDYLSKQAGRA